MPCQVEAAAQTAFLGVLPGLEAQVEAGRAVLCYADATPPTHNTRCTRAWCQVGKERPLLTASGREQVKLNFCPTQVLLDETERVGAQSTRRLYEQLLAAHPDGRPLYVVCDNARYYQNQGMTHWLSDTRIVQVFLPPCSPNLDLIERLWKLLRQKIIHTTFYRTKGQFRTAVHGFFDRLPEFGQEFTALLTRNFHILYAQTTA